MRLFFRADTCDFDIPALIGIEGQSPVEEKATSLVVAIKTAL